MAMCWSWLVLVVCSSTLCGGAMGVWLAVGGGRWVRGDVDGHVACWCGCGCVGVQLAAWGARYARYGEAWYDKRQCTHRAVRCLPC